MKKDKRLTKTELKKRQKRTLDKMTKTRKDDFLYLREIIKGKLRFAEEQRDKLVCAIDKARQSIKTNEETYQKVAGMIIVLQELLEEKTEQELATDGKSKG